MRCVPQNVVLLAILSMCDATATFCPTASCGRRLQSPSPGLFMAKKLKKKGGRKKAAVSGGLKGFGSSTPKSATSSGAAGAAKIDRSKPSLAFYDYLEKNGAGDNLKRVALARFPIALTWLRLTLYGTHVYVWGALGGKNLDDGSPQVSR